MFSILYIMFDTHCHLNFKRYKKNLDEVISHAFEAGISHIVIPGTDVKQSQKAVEVAQKHDQFYAAVGIHPHHAIKYLSSSKEQILKLVQDDIEIIESLLSHPKVVAIGEVGMDKHGYENTKYSEYAVDERFIETQRELFREHIKLAIKHNKSLILHNREATDELVSILNHSWDAKLEHRTVLHCCEADERLLAIAQDHTMFIGVDGDVTFDVSKQEFIKKVPIDMLVLETDSPFILPEPLLSQKKYPNEPAYLTYIAQSVAHIKGLTVEEVTHITTENGKRLFQIE